MMEGFNPRAFTEQVMGGNPFAHMVIGARVTHPDGRTVEIVDGELWAKRGFSNHWTWREVREDGTLGERENGYGWKA